ncbi:MAG: DUF1800 family protein [Aeromicrobium erythreum]
MATRPSAATRPQLLSEANRHLASRFSTGVDDALVLELRAAKGAKAWFEKQLVPSRIRDTAAGAVPGWYPRLAHSPQTAWANVKAEKASAWDYGMDFVNYSVATAILSRRHVQEVMSAFWSNLLYIPAHEDRSFPWRYRYDRTIRAKALTSYREILQAAVVHPAMTGWLTNDQNTRRGINENLGRELLELFTVGRTAGYDEDDVKDCARLLTGFRVKVFDGFDASYAPELHWTGTVNVLGFQHRNTAADGRPAVAALLAYLAEHPATARRIAYRLGQRFVDDEPSESFVATVAAAYRKSRSDVRATLRAVVKHPQFLASRRRRLRTPVEDVVASARVLGLRPTRPTDDRALAQHLIWMAGDAGQAPFRWPRPDGFPETHTTYASPARMLHAWNHHYALAGNWWKSTGSRPKPSAYLPTAWPRTLGELVDHQSRVLLGRTADPRGRLGRVGHARSPREPPVRAGLRRRRLEPDRHPRHRAERARRDAAMSDDLTDCGCADYGLTRRSLLKAAGAVGAAGIVTSMIGDALTSTVYGATDANVLVVLSLRGGADGLSMVVPHAEAAYRAARPDTAVATSSLLHADPTFGLHPEFAPLSSWWGDRKVAALHAVGLPAPNRSHFEAMERLEDADPGSPERVGWINRMISSLATGDVLTGMNVGSTTMPTSLVGPAPAVAAEKLDDLQVPFQDDARLRGHVTTMLSSTYGRRGGLARSAANEALALAERAGTIGRALDQDSGATYAKYSDAGEALKQTARLVRAGVGVRAVAIDAGGWDHHTGLRWNVASRIKELATNLDAFFTDLGAHADRVTLVTLSEFGRRLQQNGAGGVDHGYGSCVLAMGAGVDGGKYYARWPGLDEADQVDGDLAVTTDYRTVLAEILASRFPEVDLSTVFPGATGEALGFMRSSA